MKWLFFAHLLFVGSLSGCATLNAQAATEHKFRAAIVLEDIGKFVQQEVNCDPGIVFQLVGAIYTLDIGKLAQGIGCLPVAAKALAAELRTETAPEIELHKVQVVVTMAASHALVRTQASILRKNE